MNTQLFDYSVDLLKTILWENNTAIRSNNLIIKKNEWVNASQTEFWQNWFTDVFDLRTANNFGLSVWSVILGLPLNTGVEPDPPGKPIWGFGMYKKNFIGGNFSNANSQFIPTIEEKRILLRLRYYQLTSRCAIPEINASLKDVFSAFLPYKVYVLDQLNMQILLVFTFDPGIRLLHLLKTFDLIPRETGVKINYFITTHALFGFGIFKHNFGNGNFKPEI